MPAARLRLEVLTPRGAGGVAVLAARGPSRGAALAMLLRRRDGRPLSAKDLERSGPRLAVLVLDGAAIDEVLVVDRPALECTELHLHGAEAVLAALADRVELVAPDRVTPADRLLRDALGAEQLALALEQRVFDFAEWLVGIRELSGSRRRDALVQARARSRVARALAEPCPVALVGARNAGKSTLLNRLVFGERALTGDLPGLTRDPVGERTVLCGYPYALFDTAGEGDASDDLERRAIELGRRLRRATLQVLVVDGSRVPTALDRTLARDASLIVFTKADLPSVAEPSALGLPAVSVTCARPADAGEIRATVGRALREVRGLPAAPAAGVGGPAALDAEQWDALAAVPDP